MALTEDVAARLRTQVPSRTVYEHAVPDGTLPAAYLLVRAAVTDEGSERMSTTTHMDHAGVWVLSVARNGDPHVAARTADAGATFARAALRDWRPSGGQWPLRFVAGRVAERDESIPETTYVAPLQYGVRGTV
jgi:hypothetical protein